MIGLLISNICFAAGGVGGSGILQQTLISKMDFQPTHLLGNEGGGAGIWVRFDQDHVKFQSINEYGAIKFLLLHEGVGELLEIDETDLSNWPELEEALFNSFSNNSVEL